MLPEKTKFVLTYFDACGFNSGFSRLSNSRKTFHRTNILHILMAVFFTLYKIRFIIRILTMDSVRIINFVIQYSAALYTIWSIVFDSHFQKREHWHFWEVLQKIDEHYSSQNSFTFKYFSCKFLLCFSTSALAILMIVFFGDLSKSEVVFMYIFLIKICEARVFYYIFCLEVLQFQLKTIENSLTNNRSSLHRLKRIREYYQYIYEMGSLLNNIFGLSQVTANLFCFYFFLADLNWIYINIRSTEKRESHVISKSYILNINKKKQEILF